METEAVAATAISSKSETAISAEDKIIAERKEKALNFLKQKYNWIAYLVLAFIIYLSVKIRSLPMAINSATGKPGLWDITTNTWTLGPDLDPFLFMRWAKYIVAHGSLFAIDTLRYVPLGYNTKGELLLHPYMMAWFHKYLASFFGSTSIEQSSVIYPIFFFAITIIAFFFLARKIFLDSLGKAKANVIALISCFFLTISPVLLPRTIAGIPEKESAGFFFLFMALYLFLCAWKARTPIYQYLLAILAGIFTTGMNLVWGGTLYIFLTIGASLFIAFVIGELNKRHLIVSVLWIFFAIIPINLFSTRISLLDLLTASTILITIFPIIVMAVHLAIFNTSLKKYFNSKTFSRIPKPIISILITLILGAVLGTIIFGIGFIPDKIGDITKPLITPITDRLGITVAENKQPFFNEWESSFGPHVKDIALYFWLFFFGSIYLFYFMLSNFNKKEKWISTFAYAFFLFAIIFSRYSPNSTLNGTNNPSILLYSFGVIVLIGTLGYYYYQYYKSGNEEKLKGIEFGLLMLFSFFFLSIVSARGAIRLVMVMALPSSIIVSFFLVSTMDKARKIKDTTFKILAWIVVGIIVISSAYSGYYFYKVSSATAGSYIPSIYTYQWQRAMSWVRNNTPQDAVFAHWWDYGYWIQTIGERATVLDGGNSYSYWDYLMGRYALTGRSNEEALEFLYSHNATYFLIDSTDIGKYSAFSSIGSNEQYDRYSWFSTFVKDNKKTQETKNSTFEIYTGSGFALDGDISYSDNGTLVFLPGGKAGVAGIITERDSAGAIISAPQGVFVYQNNQYRLPLRYAFDRNQFIDFGSGVEAGIFIFPQLIQSGSNVAVDYSGALLYLSNKTVKSQLARLYLYGENNPYFPVAHIQDDIVVEQISAQVAANNNISLGNFILYNGELRGPIKIWEIHYPKGMKANPEYLQTTFPESIKSRAW